ncbi:MAG TPA: hypothetical protein VID72_07885 [Ktedonobacterales bacterium]
MQRPTAQARRPHAYNEYGAARLVVCWSSAGRLLVVCWPLTTPTTEPRS